MQRVQSLFVAIACLLLGCGEKEDSNNSQRLNEEPAAIVELKLPSDSVLTWNNGSDWPRFLGPNSDSKSPETGLSSGALRKGLTVQFQLPLGEGYATVAISDGRMYVFDRIENLARLRCCDSKTGEVQWRFTYETNYQDMYGYDGGPRAQPIIDGERIYLYGVEGVLHCLDLKGEVVWHKDVNDEYGVVQNFFGVGSCPYVYEELLIVMVGGSDQASRRLPPGALDRVRGNGTGIVAFNKHTGKEVWRLSDELASYSSPTVTRINGRPCGLAFMRGGLLAFHPETGRQCFFFPWRSHILESANASNPVVVGDTIFVSETYGPGSALLKVVNDGYEIVWKDDPRSRDKSMQTHWNTAIHVDGHLYGSSGRHRGDAELRCIEIASGKVKWSKPGLTRSSLLYVDGHFICLGEDGRLWLVAASPVAYDAQEIVAVDGDGNAVEPLLEYPAWAAPVLSHGLLYVRGNGKLVCLRLAPD